MYGNNGKHYDLLADRGRTILDRQLLEGGGQSLWALEHKLRLFNELLELREAGSIAPGNTILIETAAELRDILCEYEVSHVLFRRPLARI